MPAYEPHENAAVECLRQKIHDDRDELKNARADRVKAEKALDDAREWEATCEQSLKDMEAAIVQLGGVVPAPIKRWGEKDEEEGGE